MSMEDGVRVFWMNWMKGDRKGHVREGRGLGGWPGCWHAPEAQQVKGSSAPAGTPFTSLH